MRWVRACLHSVSSRYHFWPCESRRPIVSRTRFVCGRYLLTSKAPVTVLAAPQDAEGLICGAYQLAHGNVPQPLTKPEQTALLKALLAQPRKRELEQASYTLLFGGLSLAALTHLTRHRMQALCAPNLLKSARYDRYVLPESVQQTGLEAQYREAFRQAGEAAVQLRAAGAGEDVLS